MEFLSSQWLRLISIYTSAHAEVNANRWRSSWRTRRERRSGEDNEHDCRLRASNNFSHDCMDVSRLFFLPPLSVSFVLNASYFDRLSKTSLTGFAVLRTLLSRHSTLSRIIKKLKAADV